MDRRQAGGRRAGSGSGGWNPAIIPYPNLASQTAESSLWLLPSQAISRGGLVLRKPIGVIDPSIGADADQSPLTHGSTVAIQILAPDSV